MWWHWGGGERFHVSFKPPCFVVMSSVERLVHSLFEALFLRFAFNVFQYSGPTFHEHQHVRGNVYNTGAAYKQV